jgi:AraC-like DNA-binding protein
VNKRAPPINEIRNVIAQLLPAGHPTLAMVANELATSSRTLQRRLAENHLTHSQLVSQARVAKACQLLSRRDIHIYDVARETGFATPSGFTRAFQSWTGKSPREYRNGL